MVLRAPVEEDEAALRISLASLAELGVERALATCDDANAGSIRTIENCGGGLEDIRHAHCRLTRRSWVETG